MSAPPMPPQPRRYSSLGAPSMAQSFVTAPSSESLLLPQSSQHSHYASAKTSLAPSVTDRDRDDDSDGSSSFSRDDFASYPQNLAGSSPGAVPVPPSPSASTSSLSSESATFQLSSPFPRPQVAHPTPARARRSSAPGKENTSAAGAHHVRLQGKVAPVGFPFAASSVVISGPSTARQRSNSRSVGTAWAPLSASHSRNDSRRSSSDLDLDLSFDYPKQGPSLSPSSTRSRLSEPPTSDHVGIPMPPSPVAGSHHGVPERELVRSPSGQLLGTRKRIRSVIELRAAYAAAEPPPHPLPVTIRIDQDDGLTGSQKTIRGFSFNPTDPLPDSPLPGALEDPAQAPSGPQRRQKHFPLPLKLVEKRVGSPQASPSPAWSVTSFFRVQPSPKADDDQFANLPSDGEISRRPSWASEFTRNALQYLGRRRYAAAGSDTSPATSPLFDINSPGARTEGTESTSVHDDDTETEPTADDNDDGDRTEAEGRASANLAVRRAKKARQGLAGLGLDLGGEDFLPRPDVPRQRRLPNVPSLSISPPPPGSDHGNELDDESDSDESALDPSRVSPSRRLSQSLAHTDDGGRLAHRASAQAAALRPASRLSFAAPKHLLVSETMPRAQLPHQASLSSSRFSFRPAPLTLVKEEFIRATGYDPVHSTSGRVASSRRRFSWASLHDLLTTARPILALDSMVHAKLFFLCGFLFGPWCWLIGGWWLRSQDGERWETRGVRCREPQCNCGQLVQRFSITAKRKHHGSSSAPLWRGVDKWVFFNRLAALGTAGGGAIVFAVAVWAASLD